MPTLLEIDNENDLASEVKDLRSKIIIQLDALQDRMDRVVELKDDPANSTYKTELEGYIAQGKTAIQNLANRY